MREPSPESGLTLKNSPGWWAGVLDINANSAMNTLLSRASPTCCGSFGEYVW